MTYEAFLRVAKDQSPLCDYVPFSKETYDRFIKGAFTDEDNREFSDFVKFLNHKGLDISHLMYNENSMPNIVYYDGFIPVPAWLRLTGTMENYTKPIIESRNTLYRSWDSKDFEKFFLLLQGNFAFEFFLKHYKELPKDKVCKIFEKIYTCNDRSCNMFGKEVLEYVYANKDRRKLQNMLNKIADKDGYIRIYRGKGSHSTPVEEAFSWTTNLNTANFFAFRYSIEGTIYRGRVHKSKVLDYIDRRNEDEVLVKYEDVENITILNKYSFGYEDFQDLDDVTYEYHNMMYVLRKLKSEIFNANGIHGILHIQRVVLLTLLMCSKLDIDGEDKQILLTSALLHDIGRTDDGKCFVHGKKSFEKIENEEFINRIFNSYIHDEEDQKICKHVIIGHAIDDEDAEDRINKDCEIEDKERAIGLLRRFKDLDALDRVRLRCELDEKYFRYPESIDFIGIAYQLLMNIEQIC